MAWGQSRSASSSLYSQFPEGELPAGVAGLGSSHLKFCFLVQGFLMPLPPLNYYLTHDRDGLGTEQERFQLALQ